MKRCVVYLWILLTIPWLVQGSEKTIQLPPDNPYAKLKAGPGAEITQSRCGICHSTDYMVMQPRGNAQQWQAVVTKMIKVYGAPLNEEDAGKIVAYLASAYGRADSEGKRAKGSEAKSPRPETRK